ncbi:DUF169 domain-containing protein [bacterium]|nr:DUF169 domain-containing protein [bacterium]
MDAQLKDKFIENWGRYFPGTDLPFALFYSEDERYWNDLRPQEGFRCMIAHFSPVLKGQRVAFAEETIACPGGVRYSGFHTEPDPGLKHFLSCGIPGEMEGLRLKKTPELVEESSGDHTVAKAGGRFLVASRLDRLETDETPEVVAWLAPPDVISALFHLAAFHSTDRSSVISPQSSGCGALINFPMAEKEKEHPRAILGMFDISARPYVRKDHLSFAVPLSLFKEMASNMEESFLITESWERVKKRL